MKKKLLFFLCVGLLFAFNADASNWERVDLKPDGENENKTFIDSGSFHIDFKELTYWEKMLKPDNSYELRRISLNCEKKEEKLLDLLIYNDKDKVTENYSYNKEWIAIAPSSYSDKIYYLLCRDGMPRPSKEREFYIKNYRKTYFSVSPEKTIPEWGK